jgi:hypothetical protein
LAAHSAQQPFRPVERQSLQKIHSLTLTQNRPWVNPPHSPGLNEAIYTFVLVFKCTFLYDLVILGYREYNPWWRLEVI